MVGPERARNQSERVISEMISPSEPEVSDACTGPPGQPGSASRSSALARAGRRRRLRVAYASRARRALGRVAAGSCLQLARPGRDRAPSRCVQRRLVQTQAGWRGDPGAVLDACAGDSCQPAPQDACADANGCNNPPADACAEPGACPSPMTCKARVCSEATDRASFCTRDAPALALGDSCAHADTNPSFRHGLCSKGGLVTRGELQVEGDVSVDRHGDQLRRRCAHRRRPAVRRGAARHQRQRRDVRGEQRRRGQRPELRRGFGHELRPGRSVARGRTQQRQCSHRRRAGQARQCLVRQLAHPALRRVRGGRARGRWQAHAARHRPRDVVRERQRAAR